MNTCECTQCAYQQICKYNADYNAKIDSVEEIVKQQVPYAADFLQIRITCKFFTKSDKASEEPTCRLPILVEVVYDGGTTSYTFKSFHPVHIGQQVKLISRNGHSGRGTVVKIPDAQEQRKIYDRWKSEHETDFALCEPYQE